MTLCPSIADSKASISASCSSRSARPAADNIALWAMINARGMDGLDINIAEMSGMKADQYQAAVGGALQLFQQQPDGALQAQGIEAAGFLRVGVAGRSEGCEVGHEGPRSYTFTEGHTAHYCRSI